VPLLQASGLTRRFGGLVAVSHLDFALESGEVVGLIGPNGAGKTTVFNLLTGFLAPDAGSVRFAGAEVARLPPHVISRRGMVRTFQTLKPFPRLTVLENALVGALAHTADRRLATQHAGDALELLGLSAKASRLPTELSIGHLKLLEVARALATRPRLLLLDEPYAGLNPAEGAHFSDSLLRLREGGVTICLIEHVMKAVTAICDRVVVLHHGEKIAEGPPAAVVADPAVVRAYLGMPDADG
jgi:branched-chain amino acid transport system ATP-binding protein